MLTSLIVAVAENGVIGCNGKLPWHISADLKYFKKTTMGAPVIMGRKTFESIGFALPGRANIVVTRNADFSASNVQIELSVENAVLEAQAILENHTGCELFVIGGAEIYAKAIRIANRIYLTRVHAKFIGDACFPSLEEDIWREIASEKHPPETDKGPSFSFTILERIVKSREC
ncbi:MAG: dihydrofolate reductase [Magnetovibrio sp.]|nr:dihydrofolate reductase [Magnetovibrio sp.]